CRHDVRPAPDESERPSGVSPETPPASGPPVSTPLAHTRTAAGPPPSLSRSASRSPRIWPASRQQGATVAAVSLAVAAVLPSPSYSRLLPVTATIASIVAARLISCIRMIPCDHVNAIKIVICPPLLHAQALLVDPSFAAASSQRDDCKCHRREVDHQKNPIPRHHLSTPPSPSVSDPHGVASA